MVYQFALYRCYAQLGALCVIGVFEVHRVCYCVRRDRICTIGTQQLCTHAKPMNGWMDVVETAGMMIRVLLHTFIVHGFQLGEKDLFFS